MAPKYRFELLDRESDAELRSILRSTSMPGPIALSLQREPDFFQVESAGNSGSQVIGVRDATSGRLMGFGSRAFRCGYVDGQLRPFGYLSGLRGLPEVRSGLLLARGYQELRRLHLDNRVPYYVTTIMSGNHYAQELLTSRRAGLPAYESLGRYHTYFWPLYRRQRGQKAPPAVSEDRLTLALDALHRFNSRLQFAPHYATQDFQAKSGLLPGFKPEHFYVRERKDGEGPTATLGVWDQHDFKQSVVTSYPLRYRVLRPISPLLAKAGIAPRLPSPGKPFRYLFGFASSFASGREGDLAALLRAVQSHWAGRGYVYLVLGAHETSPLAPLFAQRAAAALRSEVYVVYWPDLLEETLPSTTVAPHLEVATL